MIGCCAPTRSPNHVRVALKKASRAMKAIRLAAMLATRGMAAEAPEAAASTKFVSALQNKNRGVCSLACHVSCDLRQQDFR